MKILCVSDQIDPQVYSPQIKERFSDIDLILSAGDLPLDYLDFIISSLNKPLFFVFGNHNTEELKHYKKLWNTPLIQNENDYFGCGAVHLGTKIKTEGKFIIAGLGGSIRYNNGANQFTDFEMFMEITKLIPRLLWNRIVHGRYVDILLTHSPPLGIHDKKDKCHTGFKIYLWFMRTFKPKFLVHGHIHLYDLCDVRSTKWKDTTVINAYSHYVIDLGD
ncbi:MAG: metallophosphoesterase [Treponema sp.]|nr:metallophosphoesterase [Treponema sp.]